MTAWYSNLIQKALDSKLKLRLWDFILKHRLSKEMMTTDELAKLPASFYIYLHSNKSDMNKPKDLLKPINELKSYFIASQDNDEPKKPKAKRSKKTVRESEASKLKPQASFKPADIQKKAHELFDGTISCVFMMGSGEVAVPSSYSHLCNSVSQAITSTNKSPKFLQAYISAIQKTIRSEDQKMLLDRKTHCDFTKAILDKADIGLSVDTFLKIVVIISKLHRIPSIIPVKQQCQIGHLPSGLFWPTQVNPMSHESMVTGHLSNWSSELQAYRITKFVVTEVCHGIVGYCYFRQKVFFREACLRY